MALGTTRRRQRVAADDGFVTDGQADDQMAFQIADIQHQFSSTWPRGRCLGRR